MPRVARPKQLVEQVIEHLRGAISAGVYPLGVRLPSEPQLMAELGIGRSTLREAVRVLAHSGVLEVRQGDGSYVRAAPAASEPLALRLRRARAREVYEVRRALEVEAARLAALRHSPADIERAAAQLAARRAALAAGDTAAALSADIDFHCAVAEASGNGVLAELYHTLALSLRAALAELWQAELDHAASAELHERLLAQIAAGDATAAAATTIALLDRQLPALAAAEASG